MTGSQAMRNQAGRRGYRRRLAKSDPPLRSIWRREGGEKLSFSCCFSPRRPMITAPMRFDGAASEAVLFEKSRGA